MARVVSAQVVIVPMPHQDGYFTLEDLWRVNLISSGQQPYSALLEIELENAQQQLVITATSPVFTVRQGVNRPVFSTTISKTRFGTNPAAGILRSTGRLPYGNYVLCYRLLDAKNDALLGQFCQEETSQPFSPPELISPYDREEITTTYPILIWKPPFPPGSTPFEYTIHLVEVGDRQNALDALERNRPLLSRRGINVTSMPYPGDALKLHEGKTYAWQVWAKSGEFELGATEVWTFKITNTPEMVPTGSYNAFRALQLAPSGSFNPAIKQIKFVYNNRYGAPGLKYDKPGAAGVDSVYFRLYPAGNYKKPLSMTVSKTLLQGVNRITIDLQSVAGITNGKNYIMIIRDPNGKEYYLEFTYYS